MVDTTNPSSTTGSQAISRALRLVAIIADFGPEGGRLLDIAETSFLHIATARRILQALVIDGFLAFDLNSKRYTIGPAIYSFAVRGNPWFSRREAFMPLLNRLAAQTQDTVLFTVRSGCEAVCLARCEGEFPIRVMSLVAGSRRPLGIGSGSLAIFAFLSESEQEEMLKRESTQYKKYKLPVTTIAEMAKEARQQGYAFNPGRLIEGVYGIAVPILESGQAVASISVTAIAERLNAERRLEIVKMIHENLKTFRDKGFPKPSS